MEQVIKSSLIGLVMLGVCFTVSLSCYASEGAVHWGYEGEAGPEHWGDLDPKFSACKGVNQSPINVSDAVQSLLSDIEFDYNDAPFSLINNGHTIQLNYGAGSSITVDGQTFQLLQFHFHSPSENHINGMSFPLEAHLVHKDDEGNLGVIGIMFKEGKENPMIGGLWSHLAEASVGHVVEKADISINAYGMLPNSKEYYRFNGSLTTPPCSEGVYWMLMKDPLEISSAQVTQFVDLIGHNNRPVQPVNARPVLK